MCAKRAPIEARRDKGRFRPPPAKHRGGWNARAVSGGGLRCGDQAATGPPSGSAPSIGTRSKLPQFEQLPVKRKVRTALVCVPHSTHAQRTSCGVGRATLGAALTDDVLVSATWTPLSSAADAGMWCGRYTSVVGPARRCFQRSARIANVCTSWRTASRAAVSRGFGRPGSSPPARATRRSRVRSEVHRARTPCHGCGRSLTRARCATPRDSPGARSPSTGSG
jgi:hypothetical protein